MRFERWLYILRLRLRSLFRRDRVEDDLADELQLDDVLAQDRLLAALSIFFSATAVLLACLGLFGLVSYRVARRTNEIGVRLARGATRGAVPGMVLGESGRLVLAGSSLGLAGAFATTHLLAARLHGVPPTDPWTIAAATTLLLLVAGVAAYLPALRAAHVDPTVALRSE